MQTKLYMTSPDLFLQVKTSLAHLTDPELALADLSLTNCDREPIHLANAIQSHGVLLTFSEVDYIILQVSQNSEQWLGLAPEAMLGQPLTILLNEVQIETIAGCLRAEFDYVNPLRLVIPVGEQCQRFEGIVHRTDGVVVLELEPALTEEDTAVEADAVSFFDFYKSVKVPVNRLQQAKTLAELVQQAVITIRELTGFDRVMLYRLAEDGSGYVIAEAKSDHLESYLELRYPASDIPKQAKELYRLNLLRIIPDALYDRVPLEPWLNPVTGRPLDLSLSVLRSVSPLHTEYLGNMAVGASMSVSLVCDQQLWGLIACHHSTPKRLSYETRTICEFFGQIIAASILTKVDAEEVDYKLKLQAIHTKFLNTIAHWSTLADGLTQNPQDLMELVDSSGVVFYDRSQIRLFGNTPPEAAIAGLVEWVDRQIGEAAVYQTNTLPTVYPALLNEKQVASGLLALRISQLQRTYLLWFRPEVIQTVNWGGQPHKLIEVDADHTQRLAPRKSFELWKETVQLTALPWKACEIGAALELRSRVIGLVLQKADELTLLNTELERSNIELDAFAYVASHDLKEPLRGIYNYSTFLIEDYGEQLGPEGKHKLTTLMRLTQRMEDLINSLLHYSRCGRIELSFQSIDLNPVVAGVIEVFKISQPDTVDFHISRPLPRVQGDRSQITELFTNLISNAIKYNDKAQKRVEIGYILPEEIASIPALPAGLHHHPPQTIFFVKDNGIGIRTKHLAAIFKIFKRLHAASQYGGGTGAGLTITKKIVERHSGTIVADSIFGEGSTFYFTLGQRP